MALVADNAGAEWREHYRAAVGAWFDCLAAGDTFTSESLRNEARYGGGVAEPHHHNAWSSMAGWFIRQWPAAGLIGICGRPQSRHPVVAHAKVCVEYVRLP
jgi:hypothetical protein